MKGKAPPTRVERIVAAEVERIATFGWPFSALAVVVAYRKPGATNAREIRFAHATGADPRDSRAAAHALAWLPTALRQAAGELEEKLKDGSPSAEPTTHIHERAVLEMGRIAEAAQPWAAISFTAAWRHPDASPDEVSFTHASSVCPQSRWARPAAARMPKTLRDVAVAVEGELLRRTRTLRA